MKEKALIAMSGGVDSSVAAYFMMKQGCDCIGATMKLLADGEEHLFEAEAAAAQLGIPHYVFDFTENFEKQVISPFISAYENGATPNPCIACNRHLKFDSFYEKGRELGCDIVVTGHYAQIVKEGGRFLLKKAEDVTKDQSYVLYTLTQEQLAHTRFPLGQMTKKAVRDVAGEQGFGNSKKPDSQDICFVPDGDYAGFIQRQTGRVCPPGDFIDEDGRLLGRHKGIIHYTIGQRKGLGISAATPLYVCRICPEANQIVLGKNEELFTRELEAEDINWIFWEEPPESFRAKAKVRYRHKEQWARITVLDKNRIHVEFDEPQRAITRGQSVVLYQDDLVLGGGIITG